MAKKTTPAGSNSNIKLMRILKWILTLILIAGNICLSAQTSLDSLISELKKEPDLDKKYKLLQQVDSILDNSVIQSNSTGSFWDGLIEYFDEIDFARGKYFSLYNKAKDIRNNGEYYSSLIMLEEVLNYAQTSNEPTMAAEVNNSLGILFEHLNRFEQSQNYYMESIKAYSQLGDSIRIGWIYLNLGSMMTQQGKYDDALSFLKRSEIILKELDKQNLVNTYINFGETYKSLKDYFSANSYYKMACDSAGLYGSVEEKFHANFYYGEFLLSENNITEAEAYLIHAKYLNENYRIGDFNVGDKARFNEVLGEYFSETGDFKLAYHYAKISKDFEEQDKLQQSINDLNRLRFDQEVNEQQRKRKQQNILIVIVAAGLVLTLILLFFIYRSYKHKLKANRLLTEMDDLKTKLFSNISHELRTPLTLILAPLEQMLSKEAEKAPSRKQIKQMRKNANAILELVNQMLDLAKIDAKSMKQELVNSDIVSFIRAHFAAFSTLAKQKEISFNSYTPPDKKLRLFDASKLEKIINNLVSNALKYTPEGGQVFCFANFPKPNLLELIIQDTGKGIQPEELSRIFDRFHQVSNSNSQQNIGTGIGLSLTKELVEIMYGQISVESIVGEGSKFKVSLPLGKEHLQNDEYVVLENYSAQSTPVFTDDEETPNCKETPEANRENLPELLIVEDHPEISEFIRENLQACYQVETAANGKQGFEMATELIPDLIISDVMMPEMDGIEMSRKIKADERTSHIPIILLTGKASHADKMQGLETGVDAFVPKPFNMKELRLRIEKIIEQRQKLRERFNKNLKLEPKDIAVSSADEKFIHKVMELIEKNMSNTEFEVNQLQDELLLSRTQLFRKIKALTNQSPGEFIRTIRLKRAASLMDQKFGNIAQITYEVGFNNPSYFAKCFKELFGMLPSEYIKKE